MIIFLRNVNSTGQGGSGCCKVVNQLCLVTILLDRVFLTSTGVLLGCWQCLTSGFSCSRSMISSSYCHQRFMLTCSPQQTKLGFL
ncbi:hypothetical protein Hanom_Chr17g01568541 [Helianthus anomalus]